MGFFDSIKKFFGGHGVKVEFTKIEKQDPTGEVTFSISDSVMKANIKIIAEGDAQILSTSLQFAVRKSTEDSGDFVVFGEEENESGTFADEILFPHDMSGGSIEDGFIIGDIDIAAKLEKMGYPDYNAAITNPDLTFLLIAEVDVKGSPFDPKIEKVITLLPA